MSHGIPAGGARTLFRPPGGGVADAALPAKGRAAQGPRPIGPGDVPAHAVMPALRKPEAVADPAPSVKPDGA